MSLLLAYFEEKQFNADPKNWKKVEKLNVPAEINAGSISLIYRNKNINAALIGDKSRQSINYVLLNKDPSSKEKMTKFIKSRLATKCISANIVGFIEHEAATEVILLKEINLEDLDKYLTPRNFHHGYGVTIRSF